MSRMSAVRILKVDLNLFSFRIQIKHQLTANNEKTRVDMCNWFNNKMKEIQDRIDKVWFSDKAHIYLDGYVNSKNIFWGTAPPQEVLQRPLHSSILTTCCAMNSKTIIGPYLFEDE